MIRKSLYWKGSHQKVIPPFSCIDYCQYFIFQYCPFHLSIPGNCYLAKARTGAVVKNIFCHFTFAVSVAIPALNLSCPCYIIYLDIITLFHLAGQHSLLSVQCSISKVYIMFCSSKHILQCYTLLNYTEYLILHLSFFFKYT